jgi:hypothetical protein
MIDMSLGAQTGSLRCSTSAGDDGVISDLVRQGSRAITWTSRTLGATGQQKKVEMSRNRDDRQESNMEATASGLAALAKGCPSALIPEAA